MAEQTTAEAEPRQAEIPEATQAQAQRLADQGYDVSVRGGSIVVDTPNPRITDDDYFHGENPHKVGYGSRGAEAEGGAESHVVEPGQSTADAQTEAGGLGWNQQAGSVGETGASGGGPDESWTNARLRDYADEYGIELHGAANKGELLQAIRSHSASPQE